MTTPNTKTAPKRTRKVKTPPKAKVAAAPKPKQPQVNPHVEAGINVARYTGPSSFVNSNRKVKIMLGREVPPSKLTDRAKAGLYALRDSYAGKQFAPRGFDNGILRDLLGAGLINLSGGDQQTIDGTAYMLDGEKPVMVKITSAGLQHGKA